MTSIAELSPAARRVLAVEATRRSLGLFHEAAFRMLHGGTPIIPGPHLDAMVHGLEQLALGTINKVLINIPPRHGKSELVSGSFPAWLLGNDPKAKVTVVSYGQDLSEPLVDKARSIFKDPVYARVFPGTRLKRGRDRREYFEVDGGGSVRAASKSGAMTGLGTHFLIVDDFHKAGESLSPVEMKKAVDLFQSTFINRFDNLNDSRMVIVMQRIHEADLAGWAIDVGGWHHINLPAIAEQDETIALPRGKVWDRRKGDVLAPLLASRKYLEEQKHLIGPRNFGAQFQQNPIVADGGQIDLAWFGQYDERPPRGFFHKVVQSVDPASTDRSTSDYSVGHTWGFRDGSWYLLDAFRVRAKFTDLMERIVAWHRRWKTDALIIEGASIGDALLDQLARAKLPGVLRRSVPRLSKADRLAACTVQLKSGAFLLPASADWLPTLRHEWLAFPDGQNDDHVDALTQFVEFAFANDRWVRTQYNERGRPIRPPRDRPRPRFYDGNIPSEESWRREPDDSPEG